MLNLWATIPESKSPPLAEPSASNEPIQSRKQKRKAKDGTTSDPPGPSKRLQLDVIAPVHKLSPLSSQVDHSPVEDILVLPYELTRPSSPFGSISHLHSSGTKDKPFQEPLYWSRHLLDELGPYAACNYWNGQLEKFQAIAAADKNKPEGISFQKALPHLQAAISSFTQNVKHKDISPKFSKLVEVLASCRAYEDQFRAVIFVKSPIAASGLVELLESWHAHGLLPFAKPCIWDERQEVSLSFTDGVYNILVVSEKYVDLDIPYAPVCVFYELYENPLTFSYAIARSTQKPFQLVCFSEMNNPAHRQILERFFQHRTQLYAWRQSLSTSFQLHFPMWKPSDSRFLSSYKSDDGSQYIEDSTTGCRMNPQDALFAINRMACEQNTDSTLFETKEEKSGSICTVRLPDGFVHTGPPSSTPYVARRQACFSACAAMSHQGKLDHTHFPVYAKSGLRRRIQHVDQSEVKQSPEIQAEHTSTHLSTRRQPFYWGCIRQLSTQQFFPHLISVSCEGHHPFLMLMRRPLPSIPETYFQGDITTKLRFYSGDPFVLEGNQLDMLQKYTARVFTALSNKNVAGTVDHGYLIAPLSPEVSQENVSRVSLHKHILWEVVNQASDRAFMPLLGEEPQCIEDAIRDAAIQDFYTEITRRYEVLTVRRDLSPLSKPPVDKHGKQYDTYIEYFKANRKGFEMLKDEHQPLLQVSPLVIPRNPFQVSQEPPPKIERFFIPELCAKSVISASTFRTLLYLPAILQTIDDFLLTTEFNAEFFDNMISEPLLREALTSSNALRGLDYERLELLGDSVLKYLASLYAFVTLPSDTESSLHVVRRDIVSNQSLFRCAVSIGLPPFIQCIAFSSGRWNPNSSARNDTKYDEKGQKPHKLSRNAKRRKNAPLAEQIELGDKVIADVCEAIIGAAFLTGGLDMAFQACKTLGLPFTQLSSWDELASKAIVPLPSATIEPKVEAIKSIEDTVGFKFRRPALLVQALTHETRQGAGNASYERLEHIGDAILDFMAVKHIFEHHPTLPPSTLTNLKSAMVSNATLAVISVEAGFHQYLLHGSPSLAQLVREFTTKLEAERTKEQKTAQEQGKAETVYWLSLDTPKILSDVVESLLAAAFLSEACNLSGVEAFWNNLLKPFYDKYVNLSSLTPRPDESLSTMLIDKGCNGMKIKDQHSRDGTKGCSVVIHGHVVGSGKGTSRQFASREAMVEALQYLETNSTFLGRVCNCKAAGRSRDN